LGVGSTVNSPLRRPRPFDQQREVITIATGVGSELYRPQVDNEPAIADTEA
jgi:hypothetical protein